MSVIEKVEHLVPEITEWRHRIHQHPETAFEEHNTADLVAEKLESFGLEVHRGLGRTGVVGTLRAGGGNRAIGLRADLDALDLQEMNDFAHKSRIDGKMHACGHDGHTAMLLGAAKHLSETKNFDGIVHFIFQPAEENVAGGREMIKDGLFEKFPVESVFGLHNMPGLEVGKIAMRTGPFMAAADFFHARIVGNGGHGAFPHLATDPVVIAAAIVQAWQSLVSRNTDPMKSAVISVTQIHGGHTTNVIPNEVELSGTTRSFEPAVQDMIESGMKRIAEGIAAAHGARAEFTYDRRYASLINSPDETVMAAEAAAHVVGADNVDTNATAVMGAEDFAWMLRERPGCYVFLGNGAGEGSCHVHNPGYDFNDKAIATGVSYWTRLVEQILPAA
ncbi:M20 aminoacylase family protein [Oceanibacterium hippocampi]|uniref:Putative hydrolase YxeP n=1 Tax=Oceanibacterium hippocampi TaxID=745714 RepID=A0A1Y5SE33_9PROT|nr:M20 aminoacylase family protein [Oceanibacterium hippocampi]SLN38592.1 putative hydrolase YxeP [Oceanibacterium hippocampi]